MKYTVKKIQLFIIILILSFFYNTSFGQGVIIDQKTYKWIEKSQKSKNKFTGLMKSRLPSSASLEKYAPSVIDQTGTAMCLSFALSTMHTILYAKNNNITNINEINENRFSPTFLYYLFKKENDYECKEGINGEGSISILKYMDKFGLPFSSDVEENIFFPFGEQVISRCYPYNKKDLINDVKQGSSYVLDLNSIIACGEVKEIGEQKIFITNNDILKSQLSTGKPCLLTAKFGPNFFEKEQVFCYSETEGKATGISHAMVIVAYDDDKDAYKILNSYGEDWGCDGYTWIKYKDLAILDGYIISFSGRNIQKKAKKKEIDEFLTEILYTKTLNYKDNCPEKELIINKATEIEESDTLLTVCKESAALAWGIKDAEADDFCKCFIEKLALEYYKNELFDLEIADEKFLDLYIECYKDIIE